MKVGRRRRSRPKTTDDPEVLALQDAVIMGRAENPWRDGTAAASAYDEAFAAALARLPSDWAPTWPRHNRQKGVGK